MCPCPVERLLSNSANHAQLRAVLYFSSLQRLTHPRLSGDAFLIQFLISTDKLLDYLINNAIAQIPSLGSSACCAYILLNTLINQTHIHTHDFSNYFGRYSLLIQVMNYAFSPFRRKINFWGIITGWQFKRSRLGG